MSELSLNYVRKTLRHYYPNECCGERRLGVYVIFKRKSTQVILNEHYYPYSPNHEYLISKLIFPPKGSKFR